MRNLAVEDARALSENHGPFEGSLAKCRESEDRMACDLCGDRIKIFFTCMTNARPDAVIRTCYECGIYLLPPKVVQREWVRFTELGLTATTGATRDFDKEAEEALEITKALDPTRHSRMIKKATIYLKAGFGKKWRVVPSILRWYEDKRYITEKQYITLKRFCASCDKESTEPSFER